MITRTNHWRIDIVNKPGLTDAHGAGVLGDIDDLGIRGVAAVQSGRIFLLDGPLSREQAGRIAAELLADPVCEQFELHAEGELVPAPAGAAAVEVYFKTGVMDPVALSTQAAIGDMGLEVSEVRTGRRYVISPAPDDKTIETIVRRVLTNGSIEDAVVGCRPAGPAPLPKPYKFELRTVPLRGLDDQGLADLSRRGHLFLSIEEMKAIQGHYMAAGRDPTDIELETFAQTWSEHCVHKTFKSAVVYRGEPMPEQPGVEHRASCVEHRASCIEHQASWVEEGQPGVGCRVSGVEEGQTGVGGRGSGVEHRPSTIEHRASGLGGAVPVVGGEQPGFGERQQRRDSSRAQNDSDDGTGGQAPRLRSGSGTASGTQSDVPATETRHPTPDTRTSALETRTYSNLLKDTIAAATRTLNKPWCLSVFVDNAGIIDFADGYGVAFKVETHNHPSAIEPYGGAATGIGGVIRDIVGCGLAAKPIANTDVFCFAMPDLPLEKIPRGILHPRRVAKGVVAGVRDYGNRMGIPTVNGAVYFDPRYLGNPLVYCGCLGLIPKDKIHKAARPGDIVLVVGGRTGRDGIHGATFSSAELTDTHAEEFAHAVQIGNAITEKKFTDVILQARDYPGGCLYNAITDCGAGGLSSAVGEMAEKIGAQVDLEKVPLKYAGLRYDEIWISEAQERMVLAVPPEKLETILALFAAEDVEATVIGRFRDDGKLVLRYAGMQVGQIDCHFLHNGVPGLSRTATWARQTPRPPKTSHVSIYDEKAPLPERLLKLLGHPTLASKHWVVRQYDHEVQGGSALKPLTGKDNDGPGDAAIVRPLLHSRRGVAIGNGLCPHWSDWDPYWMAVASVDEAIRNVICAGAEPGRIAILDNFCWGKTDDPQVLGALVRAAQGAHDAAVAFDTPFISGKDSLNNEFALDPADARSLGFERPRISIPGTLLISAIGIVEDVRQASSMDLKGAGNLLVLVGPSWAWPDPAGNLPFDWDTARNVHLAVSSLIRSGQVASAHDCSEGGILVAVAEMCLAGRRGATLDVRGIASLQAPEAGDQRPVAGSLSAAQPPSAVGGTPGSLPAGGRGVVPQPSVLGPASWASWAPGATPAVFAGVVSADMRPIGPKWSAPSVALDKWLLAEAPSRYVIEVCPSQLREVTAALGGVPWVALGVTGEMGQPLTVQGAEGRPGCVALDDLCRAWRKPLDW